MRLSRKQMLQRFYLIVPLFIITIFGGIYFLSEDSHNYISVVQNDYDLGNERIVIFNMPPTEYKRIDGLSIPAGLSRLKKFSARVTKGEYEPFSLLIYAGDNLNDLRFKWDEFKGPEKLSATVLNVKIAAVWYQAGIKSSDIRQKNNKLLTQELLVNDDSLVIVDYQSRTNYLKIKSVYGTEKYIDISTPDAVFPDNVIVKDAESIKPFSVKKSRVKQIWFTLKVPENAKPGVYSTSIKLFEGGEERLSFPIEFEVLPFTLSAPKLVYSLYYHGMLSPRADPYGCYDKDEKRMRMELTDMKEHGVIYPTNYQSLRLLGNNLKIRNSIGLPTDYAFHIQLERFRINSDDRVALDGLRRNIREYKTAFKNFGYNNFYAYALDEAKGENLTVQRTAWEAAKKEGAKIFVACTNDAVDLVGDLLDIAILHGNLNPEQAKAYHSKGNKIFSYHNPQVGQENPEVYRRNYGLALWKAGYDGVMNYAYQKSYGSFWNDFDDPKQWFREETFTYPTIDSIITTIQWEGFREGVDDIRYLSTLLDLMERQKKDSAKVKEIEEWLKTLNPAENLDEIRNGIIDKILSLTGK